MRTHRLMPLLLALLLLPLWALSESAETVPDDARWMGKLLGDLLSARETPAPDDAARIDADVAAIRDEGDRAVAFSIAEHWKRVYLDPDYRLLLLGEDDPALLQVPDASAHAVVVLGYELNNGEMTPELMARCDAGAAVARAFPEAILVCTGGATGANNPLGHTEAGLMKDYLVRVHGIGADRIFTDDRAMTTAENAVNTFRILRGQNIRTMTIVTSAYHQRWGQVLYNALAAQYLRDYGYRAEIVGNYCCPVEPENAAFHQDARIAIRQLGQILRLPQEVMPRLPGRRQPPPAGSGEAQGE